MPLLLLALVAAAHAKKPKQDGPALPRIRDAEFPTGEVEAAVVPQLTGPDSVLTLEGLTRNTVSFSFRADTAPLGDLDPDEIDAVFGELAADPNWRVTRDAGGRVAWMREPDGFTVGTDGWHIAPDRCWRVGLREGTAAEPAWTSSNRVVRVPASQGLVEVHGFRPDGGTCAKLAVALRVEGAVTLEIFEASSAADRPVTQAALGGVPYHVANLAFAATSIAADGFDPLGLPDKEPLRITDPSLSLSAGPPGAFVLRARVNPGEPGWSWLRLVTTEGAPWEEETVATATLEASGWSRDPTHGFYLQSTVPAVAGPAFGATAELWFQGEEGPPRRLHADPVTVPAR